jgi:hypothetical protein
MGSWNYRLTVETVDDEQVWSVRELYYDDTGEVVNWTQDAVGPSGESWKECANDLSRMVHAMALPAFDVDAGAWCDRHRRPVA